jgi:hypothetical protein
MTDTGAYVNTQLKTAVPWGDLLNSAHLQTVLHAIVQRLDRQDTIIASVASPGSAKVAAAPMTVRQNSSCKCT